MASKDLINLGYSPDSGTGDSARRGGEKINNLFSDIYAHFGDSVINQDPTQPYYGYKRPYFEYEYKTGELHPAGRFVKVNFKTPTAKLAYDSEWGHGYDSTGTIVDTDGDGIPDIYRDSEWYFLSRGERIDADLSEVDSERLVHFVLPIASPGDQIIIRDGLSTWKKNIFINIWTTPYEFSTVAQVQEWQTNTKFTQKLGYPDSDSLSISSPTDGVSFRSNWHKVTPSVAIQTLFEKLAQPFAISRTTDPYQKLSPTYYQNITRYQMEFLYTSYEEGWLVRLVVLDAADLSAVIAQLSNRLNGIDSDLDRGLYVSADSDIRHTVPIFRRTADGREIHGNLSLRGDDDSIMTTIDSEDTALVNDLRVSGGGDTVQPLTTTIRFKLRDNVKVKDDLFVGNDLEVGRHLQVGEMLTIDSDLAYFYNNVQIHEKLTVDSDVYIRGRLAVDSDVSILGELDVARQARFAGDVRIGGNLWVGGDATTIETESLRVKDNIITLSKDADLAPVVDTGLIFQRYDRTKGVNGVLTASDDLYNTYMVWNETTDKFTFGETVSSDSEQVLVKDRKYAEIARGEFILYDSENDPRVVFEKAKAADWLDGVRGTGFPDHNFPNERPTVQPDYALYVKTNAVFGRDSDDVVVFKSRIMSNLIPFGDEKFNLGDSDNKWNELYLSGNTIYLGSVKIKELNGAIYFLDSDDNRINTDSAAVKADSVVIDSDLQVGASTLLLGTLHVQEHAQFDSDVEVMGNTYIRETLTVDSDVFLSGDLRVDSDAIIKGRLTVGKQTKINDDLVVTGNVQFDSDLQVSGTLDVSNIKADDGTIINIHDYVYMQHGLAVDSDVILSADLRVDSDVIIKGKLTVGKEVIFSDDVVFNDNAFFDSDVIIRGNLLVNGTQTAINTQNLEVFDRFITLNKAQPTPINDMGFVFTRYDSDTVSAASWNAILEWNESTDSFILGETSSSGNSAGDAGANPPVTDKWISFGNAASTTAPFVFDDSGNSDPGGAPAGWAGGNRPTLTGDGTGVIDGGTF